MSMLDRFDLSKLGGVIRYELLINWRLRRWLVAAVGISAVGLLFLFALPRSIGEVAGEERPRLALAILFALQPMLHLCALLMPPTIFSDALPRDRRWNVEDLLNTLPLPEGIYLTGKLGAAIVSASFQMLLAGVVIGLGCWLLIGPFIVSEYVTMFLIGVLPVAALSGGLGVLLTAGQSSRRQEVMIALSFCMICLVGLGIGVIGQVNFGDYLNPARPLILRYYLLRYLSLSPTGAQQITMLGTPVSEAHVLLTNLLGVAEILLGWFVVRLWLLRRR